MEKIDKILEDEELGLLVIRVNPRAKRLIFRTKSDAIYVSVPPGTTSAEITDAINRHRLHLRKDGQPVTSKQVYATICRFPEMFTKEAGRIMLMI